MQQRNRMYRAFGLNISCGLPVAGDHGMIEMNGDVVPDVLIHTGVVPEKLQDATYTNIYTSIAPGKLLLKIDGVARYLIQDGKEILIQPEEHSDPGDVAIFAFGSAMGTLLHQRGIVAIHGSAVRTSGGAVIFTGQQGAGKSTTAAALSKRGWEFMADDICAIHIQDGVPYLYPGLVRAKLTEESYQRVVGDAPQDGPVMPLAEKYAVRFETNLEPQRLSTICLLEKGDTVSAEQILGAKRFLVLMENIYRPRIHRYSHDPAYCFEQYSLVSSAIGVIRVTRADGMEHLEELLTTIEECVLRPNK